MSEQTAGQSQAVDVGQAQANSTEQTDAGQQPQAQQQAQPLRDPAKQRDFSAAVRKTVDYKAREAALKQQEADLKPMRDIHALAQAGKLDEAVRQLVGKDKIYDLYQALTPDVLGVQEDTKGWESLPKPVRERIAALEANNAKLAELEQRAARADELAKRIDAMEEDKKQALASLSARQSEAVAQQVYRAGYDAVMGADSEDAEFVRALPDGNAALMERWQELLGEMAPQVAGLSMEERQKQAQALVSVAAKSIREEAYTRFGSLLQPLPVKGKVMQNRPGRAIHPGRALAAPQATSTTGPKTTSRTVTPGGVAEPRAVDLNNLSRPQRLQLLRNAERDGKLKIGD